MGIPLEFVLFGIMLLGVAVLHRRPMAVALTGLSAIVIYELFGSGFPSGGHGLTGLAHHFVSKWVGLADLLLLLVAFAILSNQFERSNIPDAMPRFLPDDWTGGFALLALVFVMSIFLDNIAAAMIGGVMAKHLYKGRVGLAFLAAIDLAARRFNR